MTPVLPDDLDVLARPVTYLTWETRATDGKVIVSAYFDARGAMACNTPDQAEIFQTPIPRKSRRGASAR